MLDKGHFGHWKSCWSFVIGFLNEKPLFLSGFNRLKRFYLIWRRIYIFGPCHLISSQFCYHVTHAEKNWNLNPGCMYMVTADNIQHPALWTCFFVMRGCHNFKGLMLKHLRKTALAQRIFQPLPQWTITTIVPARQPAFRFPSKHLSHLWLDPCCLDTYMQSWLGHFQTSKDEVSVVPGNK